MSVSYHRADRFDVREHIRRAAAYHVLLDLVGLVAGPLTFLISDHIDPRMWIIKAGFGIGMPLMALWDGARYFQYLRNPLDHPALQWRKHAAPGALIAELEREIAETGRHFVIRGVALTPHWLVRVTPLSLVAIPYSQMAWAHEKIMNPYTLSSMASDGKRFALVMHTRDGKTQDVGNFPEPETVELLRQIVARAPWAIVGFDGRTDIAWLADRAKFLRVIDERAEAIRQQAAAAAAAAAAATTEQADTDPI